MKAWIIIAALMIVVLSLVAFFVKRRRMASEKAAQEREKAARESAKLASFMQAAIAVDQGWMRANDQAQAAALRKGDKAEWKRLFDEKSERLSAAKGNMAEYLEKYYPYLWRTGLDWSPAYVSSIWAPITSNVQ